VSWGEIEEVAPNPCGEKIVDLAKQLLKDPRRWGLIGVEYAFFHQFFNEDLQLELKRMRHQLYGQEEPPMRLTLCEAEETFARYVWPTLDEMREQAQLKVMEAEAAETELKNLADELHASREKFRKHQLQELADQILAAAKDVEVWQRGMKELSMQIVFRSIGRDLMLGLLQELRSKGLLNGARRIDLCPSLGILAAPFGPGEGPERAVAFWEVARQLEKLREDLPANTESLHMALVCGTPPVPPPGEFLWRAQPGEPIVFRIYSAKVRDTDISRVYRGVIQDCWGLWDRKYSRGPGSDVQAEWIEEALLPHLKISVSLRSGLPPVSHVHCVLRREAAGKPFYDRRTKVFDIEKRIRAWATASLTIVCGMGKREALRFWEAHYPEKRLSYWFAEYSAHCAGTVPQEVQLQQEIIHVQQRVATMREYLAP